MSSEIVGLDMKAADAYAKEYFGEGDHVAFGVDGSMENVPVFVKTENNEDVLTAYLAGRK